MTTETPFLCPQKKKNEKSIEIIEEEDISEEDKALKENLELLVTRAKDVDRNLAKVALDAIGKEIRYELSLVGCQYILLVSLKS